MSEHRNLQLLKELIENFESSDSQSSLSIFCLKELLSESWITAGSSGTETTALRVRLLQLGSEVQTSNRKE